MRFSRIRLHALVGCAFLLAAGIWFYRDAGVAVSAKPTIAQSSGCLLPNFREAGSYEEAGMGAIVAGDFSGDANIDLLVANPTERRITLLRGDGLGGIVRGSVFSTEANIPIALYRGDFNGDRLADALVLLESSSPRFQYFWSVWFASESGVINRTTPQLFQTLTQDARYEVLVEDFNGDGRSDVVIGTAATLSNLTVYLSRGEGSFTAVPSMTFTAGSMLFTQDWDFDNRADLFIANSLSGRIHRMRGNGDGTLGAPQEMANYGSVIRSVSQGDMNLDGPIDWQVTTGELIGANGSGAAGEDSFQLFYTQRNGSFGFDFSWRWPERWRVWQTADVTADRRPDVILRGDDNRAHAIVINGGQFNNCYRFAYAPFDGLRLLADLTWDAQVEAITVRDARLTVWRNQSPAPVSSVNQPPSITVTNFLSVPPGANLSGLMVAEVSDLETPAGALRVEAVEPPAGMTITLTNNNGIVSGTFQATCQYQPRFTQFIVKVTDAGGASVLAPVRLSATGINVPRGLVNQPAQIELREGIATLFGVTRQGSSPRSQADVSLFSDVNPVDLKFTVAGIELQYDPNSRDLQRAIYRPVRLPVGTHTLRVTSASACGQFILNEVTVVVRGATSTCAYPVFDTPQVLARTRAFRLREVGDFNGDGITDALVTDGDQLDTNLNVARIWTRATTGEWLTIAAITPPWNPGEFKAADFNNDGRLDLAVSANVFKTRSVAIYLNNGPNAPTRFSLANQYAVGYGGLTTGDFNQDGRIDLALAEAGLVSGNGDVGLGGLTVLLNEGNGNFVDRTTAVMRGTISTLGNDQWRNGSSIAPYFSATSNTLNIALSGGGAAPNNPRWHNWVGDGRGGFTGGTGFGGNLYQRVFSADFDADNRLDLAWVNGTCSDGLDPIDACAGNFDQSSFRVLNRTYRDFSPIGPLATADFNLDGRPDIAFNTGDVFVSGTPGPYCASPKLVASGRSFAGDFNGDGKADLLVNEELQGRLFLYLNRSVSNARSLAVVSAANYRPVAVARDSIVAAFGTSITTTTETARTIPLPTTLAGARVIVRDSAGVERDAPLFFASAGQVNFLIPAATAEGTATIRLISSDGVSAVTTLNIVAVAPGIFTANASGNGIAAAQVLRIKANGQQSYEPVALYDAQGRVVPIQIDYSVATDQIFLVLYGTGWRGRGNAAVTATIGGKDAEVLFVGAHPSLIGVDQLNLRLPRFQGLSSNINVGVFINIGELFTNPTQIMLR